MDQAVVKECIARIRRALESSATEEMVGTVALGQVRAWAKPELTRPEILLFLESVSEFPPETAVVIGKGTISLLSDNDGNILAFR
jgi:hypothetical protein